MKRTILFDYRSYSTTGPIRLPYISTILCFDKSEEVLRASIASSTTLNSSSRHLARSLWSTQYRGSVSRPLAFHTFSIPTRQFVRSGGGKSVCRWRYRVGHGAVSKALSNYRLTFHDYAERDLGRHLPGRYA